MSHNHAVAFRETPLKYLIPVYFYCYPNKKTRPATWREPDELCTVTHSLSTSTHCQPTFCLIDPLLRSISCCGMG